MNLDTLRTRIIRRLEAYEAANESDTTNDSSTADESLTNGTDEPFESVKTTNPVPVSTTAKDSDVDIEDTIADSDMRLSEVPPFESPWDEPIETSDPIQIVEEEFARFESEIEAMSDDEDQIGQARLTDREVARLPMGNQHTKWNVIRWQAVKAAAIHYGVTDWISYADPNLTYEENIDLMRQTGGSKTMKEMVPRRA